MKMKNVEIEQKNDKGIQRVYLYIVNLWLQIAKTRKCFLSRQVTVFARNFIVSALPH
jgi:hypothetical protein